MDVLTELQAETCRAATQMLRIRNAFRDVILSCLVRVNTSAQVLKPNCSHVSQVLSTPQLANDTQCKAICSLYKDARQVASKVGQKR